MTEPATTHLVLRLYLAASLWMAPLTRWHLSRRVARGKENPARAAEKLGIAAMPRPDGHLIWMHAVGVGEVLALPGLVNAIRARRPEVQILITSSSRTSAEALAPNLPEGARHQFLPLDAMPFVRAFLDHWRPDLAVWAERDIWPALVVETQRRGIPQLLVNGRMSAASYASKTRARRLFADLYNRMRHIGVQDPESAAHFRSMGVASAKISIDGSLKAGADPLADQPEARAALQKNLAGRRIWLAASTHPADEIVVSEAHKRLLLTDPDAGLIVAPRDPHRAAEVLTTMTEAGLSAAPVGIPLLPDRQAYVIDRIGQLGLWYRLADAAFIGGSLAQVGGHNPYEPARLDCAILHGPNIWNFAEDYGAFHAAGAALLVQNAAELAAGLQQANLAAMRQPAALVARRGKAALEAVAERVLAQLPEEIRDRKDRSAP